MTPIDYIAQANHAERLAKALTSAADRQALLSYAERLRAEASKSPSQRTGADNALDCVSAEGGEIRAAR